MNTREIGKSPRCLMSCFMLMETMNSQTAVLAKNVNFNCHSSSGTNLRRQGDNQTSVQLYLNQLLKSL